MAPTTLRPTATHLIPVCSSAVTLGLSLFQFPVFYTFVAARPSVAGRTLSVYWNTFIYKGIGFIVSPVLVSSVAGYLAARNLAGTTAAPWFRYGAIAAAGHFAFAYPAALQIEELARGAKDLGTAEFAVDRRNREAQWFWLAIHTLRTALVDVPALYLFAKGFSKAFM